MQALYQIDIVKTDAHETLETFWERQPEVDADVKTFASHLVEGVAAHLEEIDQAITECAQNWHVSRMAAVDRNILRLGTYELLFEPEVPPKVTINEAIDLAKKFGDAESGGFVNGILDKIYKNHAVR